MDVTTTRGYEKYCQRMLFEHSLINNRLNWLLLSQTLLFASYAASFEKSITKLQKPLPVLAMFLSVLAFTSIVACLWSKRRLWLDVRDLPGHDREPFWVSTRATCAAALAEVLVPVAFFFAWAWLLLGS